MGFAVSPVESGRALSIGSYSRSPENRPSVREAGRHTCKVRSGAVSLHKPEERQALIGPAVSQRGG